MAAEQCTRSHAPIAAPKPTCRSNRHKAVLSTVGTATKNTGATSRVDSDP